jgi:molecular chaperone GrpE
MKESQRVLHEDLQMTELQLLKVFKRHMLEKIAPAEGEKFDPNFHEALFQQPLLEGKSPGSVAVIS